MTAIVPLSIKTKKQLKAHLEAGNLLTLENPTPWGSDSIILNANLTHRILVNSEYVKPGYFVCCTNHPKRSWFAKISIKPDGSLKVS